MWSLGVTPDLTTCLAVLGLFLIFYLWTHRRDPRLPPCPTTPLPILGHILSLTKNQPAQFTKWRETCGEVFSIYIGGSLTVVVNGYDAIKEIFVKKADASSDRPALFPDMVLGYANKGVIFSSGSAWKEQRSTVMSILRTFGMGKDRLAQKVHEEIDFYIAHMADLHSKQGNRVDIRELTYEAVSNVICSIIIGKRLSYDDTTFKKLIEHFNTIVATIGGVALVNVFPFLRHLPGDLFQAKKLQANVMAITELFVKKYIKSKGIEEYDESNLDNFIAAYIFERKKMNVGQSSILGDRHLEKVIWDMFGAGTETTSTTITWCLLYILHHPDVQEKVYQEIVREVGTERRPNMGDKPRLIYLNAVIKETQRLGNIVPLSVPHVSSADISYRSYTIPKGTQLILNLDSVLQDKKIWGEDANKFRPERFIDLTGKLLNPEEFIPFSIGRRVCLGESLANMELFLFLSAMFQRFKFLPVDPAHPPSLKPILGMASAPQHYEVLLVDRLVK